MTAARDKRVAWRCRRGTRELDRMALRYFENFYAADAPARRRAFEELLELPDPDLHALLIGRLPPASAAQAEVLCMMRGDAPDSPG